MQIKALGKMIRVIDLPGLAENDIYFNVHRLCYRVFNPLTEPLLKKIASSGFCDADSTVGDICVNPPRIKDCIEIFKMINPSKDPLKMASVVTESPIWIEYARDCGAS